MVDSIASIGSRRAMGFVAANCVVGLCIKKCLLWTCSLGSHSSVAKNNWHLLFSSPVMMMKTSPKGVQTNGNKTRKMNDKAIQDGNDLCSNLKSDIEPMWENKL